MTEDDPTRIAAAWHEAGHLAAGFLLGAHLGGASIKPGHWHFGQAEARLPIDPADLEAAWWAAVAGEPIDPMLRDRVERQCLISLAGPATEVRAAEHGIFTAEPPPDPHAPAERRRFIAAINSGEPKPQSDLGVVDALLRRITASADEAAAYRQVLIERTYTLAGCHPRFWPLAEAFARGLLIHDELTGTQVAAVVAEVNGEESPDAIPISA